MKIYELIALGNSLKDTKVGSLSNEALRKYIRLIVDFNKCSAELEEKKRSLATEAIKQKNYNVETLTPEQESEIVSIISPLIDEYVLGDCDSPTKFLSWDELYNAILNNPENSGISINEKSMISNFLCSEEV